MKTIPQTVTMTDLARLCGLSARRLQQLAQDGVFAAGESGRYDLAGALQGILAHYSRQSATTEYRDERLKKLAAERALAELELAEREGVMVHVAEFGKDYEKVAVEIVRVIESSKLTDAEKDSIRTQLAKLHDVDASTATPKETHP